MALQKQVITIPLAEGLDTKTDEYQVTAGKALLLENARFYKVGKLQKRFGNVMLTDNASTGLLSSHSISAIISDDLSLNAVTSNGVYSLSEGTEQWEKLSDIKDKAKIRTEFVAKSAYNHFNPDMDFNESLGLLVSVFREMEENNNLTASPVEFVTVAIEDVNTGVKKIRKISTGNTLSYKNAKQKIMITVSGGVPRITLFYEIALYNLRHHVLDKNLDDVITANTIQTLTLANNFKNKIDVCRDDTNIFLASMYETTLKLTKLGLDGAILSSTTVSTTNRLGSDPFNDFGQGLSICQSASVLHVFFISNTTVSLYPAKMVGLGLSKAFAVTVSETSTVGSWDNLRDLSITLNGSNIVIAATEVSIASNKPIRLNKFTASWSSSYVITEPGVLDGVIRAVAISRPFVINSVNYVVCKCPEVTQPTGLIYNMDTMKFVSMFSPFGLSDDRLTSQTVSAYHTGTCNAVPSGATAYSLIEKSYGVNTNNVATFDFNASIAVSKLRIDLGDDLTSGTRTKIGETNYYTDGATIALDGRGAYESGFSFRPLITAITSNTSGGTTTGVASKNFSYIAVYAYFNGKGELERSVPSPAVAVVTSATTTYVNIAVKNNPGSFKDAYYNDSGTYTQKYATEIILYRTTHNGTTFYRVSSKPSAQFGDIVNLADASADSAITDNEQLYTTGGILENDSTPNAKFSTAGGNRLFLGGLEEEDEIAYSKKQLFGEAVSFSDFFRIRISSGTSSDKSRLSAIGYLDGKLIIFRENSIYYIAGDGPLETGTQNSFTEPEVISSDTGCVEPRSVVNIPTGLLFKSKKGIYVLDRAMQVSYIGAGVEEYNQEGVVSAIISDKYNEARFYTNAGNCLVYNYIFGTWSSFNGQTSISADIWAGRPVQVLGSGVSEESETVFSDNGSVYSMKVKTPWLKLNGLQDFGRIWTATILGKYKSVHDLIVKVRYDYDESYIEEFTVTPQLADTQYQYRINLKKQLCESVQFEIYDASQTGESMELSAITLEVGLRKGSMKLGMNRKY